MHGYIVWLNEDGILGRLGHKFIEVFSSHTRYGFDIQLILLVNVEHFRIPLLKLFLLIHSTNKGKLQ